MKTMLDWLLTSKPNGNYPLPIPVPLRLMPGHFVRPYIKQAHEPFITMTQIGFEPGTVEKIVLRIKAFCEEATDVEDILMVVSGMTDNEIWITVAYKSKGVFERKGLTPNRFEVSLLNWNEQYLALEAGYFLR